MSSVIFVAPQGAGKNLHRSKLQAHFGCSRVVDEWTPGQPVQQDALHLAHEAPPKGVKLPAGCQVVEADDVGAWLLAEAA